MSELNRLIKELRLIQHAGKYPQKVCGAAMRAANLIEYQSKSTDEWISVDDRLPEGKVLICYLEARFGGFTKEIEVGYYDNPDHYENPEDGEGWKFWLSDKNVVGKGVTHWKPLPQPPK